MGGLPKIFLNRMLLILVLLLIHPLMTRVLVSSPFGNKAYTGKNIEDKLTEIVKTWNTEGM